MPTLTIDNQTLTVPDGTNVLEAAKQLGIVIPHFCYHEALGAVGSCRLCAMSFLEGPVKGVQMACMVEAKDGMVVSTLDQESMQQRAHVIEWLMMNHPHDCPICDEGGECQLQDMAIAGGHSIRRYEGAKRTYVNQQLGPFIEQEMNRCIQCYRCLRTYRDYCGGDDFGVMGSRNRIFFGRFRDGRLESPFSGNLVDVCPTGVFTDKTYRFKSRIWDLEEAPSICPHCSLGCAVIPGGRYRELQRVRAGVNREVNGFFICDRGRFGGGHVNHPDRPRVPHVSGHDTGWAEAIAQTNVRIETMIKEHGIGSVALLGSPRATLEANFLLQQWAEQLGTPHLVFDPHPGRNRAARVAAARLGDKARSLEEIRHSDLIVVVGADPSAEGPLLALALRQAVRNGGRVLALDPRPIQLPCTTEHLPLATEKLPAALKALAEGETSPFSAAESTFLENTVKLLTQAKRPVLVGAVDLLGEEGVSILLNTVESLNTPERPCGAQLLLGGPNSFGGALLAGGGPDFDQLLDLIQDGRIRALICLEADPCGDYPDSGRAETALSRLDALIVLDALPTATVRRADLLLPTTAVAEQAGSFINNEGRMLPFEQVIQPGLPIRVIGAGNHPPREFSNITPGALPRPAWAVLAELVGIDPTLAAIRTRLAVADSRFAGLAELSAGGEGRRVSGCGILPPPAAPHFPHCQPARTLPLLVVEHLFGSEILSGFSAPLVAVRPEPYVLLHPQEAERLGLIEGDRAHLVAEKGRASVIVRVTSEMAQGTAIVPRLRHTALEVFVPGSHLDCTLEKEVGT
jgi:NADH-quinone oxidoreductase subunit G